MKVILVWLSVFLSCALSVKSVVECPPGFTTDSSKCTQIECCVPKTTHAALLVSESTVCPTGSVWSGIQCVQAHGSQTAQHPTNCQQGFVLGSGGQCIPVSSGNSQITQQPLFCQPGYVQGTDGRCFQTAHTNTQIVHQPTICPQGSIQGNGGQCIQVVAPNTQIVQQPTICPQSFIQGSGGQCIQEFARNTQIVQQPTICPQSFIQGSGGQCIQEFARNTQIVQQPTICQQGFMQGYRGQCIQLAAANTQYIQQPTICQQNQIQGSLCAQQPIYMQQPCAPTCQPVIPQAPTPIIPIVGPTRVPVERAPPPNRPIDDTIIYINTTRPDRIQTITRDESDTSVTVTLTNVIHTNNTIHAPVNITNHNVINTPVYISESSHTEQNAVEERTSAPQPEIEDRPRPEPQPRQQKCCSVLSPRICRIVNGEWKCSHQKYHRCGSFCIAPKIYLRTHAMRYRESRLIVPPLRTRTHFVQRGQLNCSGCMSGQSHHCSQGCYTYDCARSRGCQYQDQEEFCGEYGGEGCTEEDGYESNNSLQEEENELEYQIN